MLIPDYAGIRMERVRSSTPGRILLQGYDETHPLVLDLKDVVIAAGSDIKQEYARVQGAFGTAPACAERFLPFPEPAARNPRPQLTPALAAAYDYRKVLRYVGPVGTERVEPWDPLAEPLATGVALTADYTVDARAPADGTTRFTTVQAAVSRAVAAGGTRRIVIRIAPGTYRELVYVPPGAPPITLDGGGNEPQAVRISAALDASTTGAAYRERYVAAFEHAAPPVRAMYDALKDLPALQTTGSATVWVRADGFQARNLTIENAYNRDKTVAHPECSGDNCPDTTGGSRVHHQAVALRVDGADKAQFEHVRLLGLQDTLFLSSKDGTETVRSFFHHTHIEGDVDFIFGDTIAFFKDCDIHAIGGRSASYVAAPDTNRRAKYGFVFDGCRFTSDAPGAASTHYYFARQWFHNERCTPYGFIPVEGYTCRLGDVDVYKAPNGTIRKRTLETVGKAVILRSRIGPHFEKTAPWSEWNPNGTLAHRPAQFSSDDYWNNLAGTAFAPTAALGDGPRPAPRDIYLGEYDNTNE
jgi:polygalacturonase